MMMGVITRKTKGSVSVCFVYTDVEIDPLIVASSGNLRNIFFLNELMKVYLYSPITLKSIHKHTNFWINVDKVSGAQGLMD